MQRCAGIKSIYSTHHVIHKLRSLDAGIQPRTVRCASDHDSVFHRVPKLQTRYMVMSHGISFERMLYASMVVIE